MKTEIICSSILLLLLLSFGSCGNSSTDNNTEETAMNAPTGQPDIDGLTKEIVEDPYNAELYARRGVLFYNKQGYDEAIRDLQHAIQLDSTKAAYYHDLADVNLDYFRSRQALAIMEDAATRFPENIPTLLKLSEYQLILKQYEESMRTIDQILKIDPQNAEAYFMFGMNFEEQGDTVRAINSYQKAVEFDSKIIDGWINLGQLYSAIGDPLAERYLDNAVRIDPRNVYALHAKAEYLADQDNLQGAIDTYRDLITVDQQYESAYFNSGLIYMDMDSIARAEEEFSRLLQVSPTEVRAYYYRGLAREMQGNIPAAIADYEQALKMVPNYERARQALQRVKEAG